MGTYTLSKGENYTLGKINNQAIIFASSDHAHKPMLIRNTLQLSGSFGDSSEGGQLELWPYSGGTYTWIIDHYKQGSNAALRFFHEGAATAVRMLIEANTGDVGIGDIAPTRRLSVITDDSGDYVAFFKNENTSAPHGIRIRCEKENNESTYVRFDRNSGYSVGSIVGDGDNTISYNESSDVRLKNNIRDCEFTIDDFDKVNIRSYERSSDRTHHGVIAQELLETKFAEFVHTGEEENKAKGLKEGDEEYTYMEVAYNKFIPMLIKSVQDANTMIKELQQEVKELKEKLNG